MSHRMYFFLVQYIPSVNLLLQTCKLSKYNLFEWLIWCEPPKLKWTFWGHVTNIVSCWDRVERVTTFHPSAWLCCLSFWTWLNDGYLHALRGLYCVAGARSHAQGPLNWMPVLKGDFCQSRILSKTTSINSYLPLNKVINCYVCRFSPVFFFNCVSAFHRSNMHYKIIYSY